MNFRQYFALLCICAFAAFAGSLEGTQLLTRASAQTAPLGNGGPSVGCADATLTCSGGYNVQVNLANANTWTANIGFAAQAMTAPSIGVDGNSSGDLQLFSTHNITTNQKVVSGFGFSATNSPINGFNKLGSYAACSGTGTFTNANSDSVCMITLATGAAVMTFHAAWTAAPVCTATDTTAAAAVKATTTTTTLTLAGTGSDVIAVHCTGNGGV